MRSALRGLRCGVQASWLARTPQRNLPVKLLQEGLLTQGEVVNTLGSGLVDRPANLPYRGVVWGRLDGPDRDPPIRRGLTGRGRALGYRLVMATGLRADELRSLERESFDLDAGTVTLHAKEEKNRPVLRSDSEIGVLLSLRGTATRFDIRNISCFALVQAW